MPIYRGGRAIFGEAIGILLLDTKFPRVPGDIGNASTFDFPVRIKMIPGATPQRIVLEGDESILPEFIKGAIELEAEGVRAITTSCGYLSTYQRTIADAVNVPVFTSSLMQVPMVSKMLRKGKKVGILTIDSRRIRPDTLSTAGITNEPIVIMGSEEVPEFYNTYPRGSLEIDPEKVEGAVVRMVQSLIQRDPAVGAIVCEATNYAPYAAAVQEATGLPWFDIITLIKTVYDGVVKQRYRGFV